MQNFHSSLAAREYCEENAINVERIKLASAVAINGLPDPGDEFFQLGMVVVRDHRARRSSLRLVGHEDEGSQEASRVAADARTACARRANLGIITP